VTLNARHSPKWRRRCTSSVSPKGQKSANAELLARDLRRAGWSEDAARYSIEKMHRRTIALDQAHVLLSADRAWEQLIRELDPARPAALGRDLGAPCDHHKNQAAEAFVFDD